MNLFKIWRGYRRGGPGYGLPFWFLDFGPGVNTTPDKLIESLGKLFFVPGSWILLRNCEEEKGLGVLVKGLKAVRARIEIEFRSQYPTPTWFPDVDRWLVLLEGPSKFNLGALRARQDLLVFRGTDVGAFLDSYSKLPCLKAIVTNGEIWDLVKDKEVRVYEDMQEVPEGS